MRLPPWLSGFTRFLRPRKKSSRTIRRRSITNADRIQARIAAIAESLEDRTLLTPVMINVDTFADVVNGADGFTSLREAVTTASTNGNANPDQINLQEGTYTLALGSSGEDANAGGDLDFTGTNSITIVGAGIERTTIDANSLDRILDLVSSGVNLTLQNLRLDNGKVTGADGGAIRNSGGTLNLSNVAISDSQALSSGANGGALFNTSSGLVDIRNSVFSANFADGDGGAIFSDSGTVSVQDDEPSGTPVGPIPFQTTFASQGVGGDGGAIFISGGTAMIFDARFYENEATNGGAIFNQATLNVTNNTFEENLGTTSGGAIVNDTGGTMTVTSSTFDTNIVSGSGDGGAIRNASTNSNTVTNSTFGMNRTVSGSGGAIGNSGTLSVNYSTISLNSANAGGGISTSGTLNIDGTIVGLNSDASSSPDLNGTVNSPNDNNIIGVLTGSSGFVAGENVANITSVIDPVLRDNGGPTETFALNANASNVAIDRGNGAAPSTDQRSSSRFPSAAPVADVGSFESNFIVNTFTDSAAMASGTLRRAIIDANSAGSGTIQLVEGIYVLTLAGTNEDAAATGDLDITGNITIIGQEPARTIIDASELDRVFDVIGAGATLTLIRVTVTGGLVGATDDGGGIRNAGRLKLIESVVIGNDSGRDGGGVASIGTVLIEDSMVVANKAGQDSGGIGLAGNANVIRASTIFQNTADRDAGGIGVAGGATLDLINSTVDGNTAAMTGGGIANNTSTVNIINSTITSNTATAGSGGGIATASTTRMINTIVALNTAPTGADLVGGTYQTGGGNLIGDNSTVAGTFPAGNPNGNSDIVGTNGSPIDPLLGPLQNNGGATFTRMAMSTSSPIIDAGVTTLTLIEDQRGAERAADGDNTGGDRADIGATEGERYVDNVTDLRSAITTANSNTLDEVEVVLVAATYILSGASGEDSNASGDLDFTNTNGIRLVGAAGAVSSVIDGGGVDRVIHVLANARLEIINATIQNGAITGTPADGGGALSQGELSLVNTIVSSNTATGDATNNAARGAGIFNSLTGSLSLFESVVRNNTATGDGIGNGEGGGIYNQGFFTSDRSTINNNTATSSTGSGEGAGVFVADGNVSITNSTISTNTASGGTSDGGGVINVARTSSIQILSSTITANTGATTSGIADTSGGGRFFLDNNAIAGNAGDRDISGSSYTTGGENFVGNGDNSTSFAAGNPNGNGDFVGTGASPLDPMLGALAANPPENPLGSIILQTHFPQDGSPLIDAGGGTQATDQLLGLRPFDGDSDLTAQRDIGAVELSMVKLSFDGTAGADDVTLRVSSNGKNFEIIDSMSMSLLASQSIENTIDITVQLMGGTDVLTVDLTNGPITKMLAYDGGGDPNDTLAVTNGTLSDVTHTATGATTGTLDLGGGNAQFTYGGLAPIDLTGSSITNLTLNLPSAVTAAVVEDIGTSNDGNQQLRSTTAEFESTQFGALSGKLTIGTNGSASIVTLNSVDSTFAPTEIALNGLDSSDTFMLGNANVIPNATLLTVSNGAFNMNNQSDVIGALAGNGNVLLGTGDLTTGGNNATTAYSGIISGAGNVSKMGTGTFTISGANTYTGSTAVLGGVLQLGAAERINDTSDVFVNAGAILDLNNNNERVGALSGNGSVAVGTVTFDFGTASSTTFGGVFTGSGTINKFGTGQVTLMGASPFSGQLNLNAGTTTFNAVFGGSVVLNVPSAAEVAVLNPFGGPLIINGGTISAINAAQTINSATAIAGNFNIGGTDTLIFTGATTLSGGSRSVGLVGSGDAEISGVINDGGNTFGLTLNGGGGRILTLSGNNTYTGTTSVGGGATLRITGSVAGDADILTAGALGIGNASAIGGKLIISGGSVFADGTPLTLANAVDIAGDFNVIGSNNLAFNGTTTLVGADRSITLAGSADLDFLTPVGDAGNAFGLTLAGGGGRTLVLSANNTYTGSTSVGGGGTILINGSVAGDAQLMSAGAFGLGNATAIGGKLIVTGGSIFADSGPLTLGNDLDINGDFSVIGGNNLAFNGNTTLIDTGRSITLAGGADLDFLTAIGDGGSALGLTLLGGGGRTLTLSNSNTYTGTTAVGGGGTVLITGSIAGDADILSAGALGVGNGSAIGGKLVIRGGSIFADGAAQSLGNVVDLVGDFNVIGSNDLTFSGATTLMAGNRSIGFFGTSDLEISGDIGDAGKGFGLILNGASDRSLTVSGNNTYTGDTVSNGTILVIGTTGVIAAGSDVIINGPGELRGTGTILGQVISNAGQIAPGLSPGTLTAGSLNFDNETRVFIELDIPTSDQLVVNNSVSLGNAGLDAILESDIPVGTEIVIIDNQSGTPINGQFLGLSEGDVARALGPAGLQAFTITYMGGDGNDVVLTSVPALVDQGFESPEPRVGGTGEAFFETRLPGRFQLSIDIDQDGFITNQDLDNDGVLDRIEVFLPINVDVDDFGDMDNPDNSVRRGFFFPVPNDISVGPRNTEFSFTPQIVDPMFGVPVLTDDPIVVDNIPVNILERPNLDGTRPPQQEFVELSTNVFNITPLAVPLQQQRTVTASGVEFLDLGGNQFNPGFSSLLPSNGSTGAIERQGFLGGFSSVFRLEADPVDFIVTDPNGRQVGFTQDDGFVNEIGETVNYTGDASVELLEIDGALPGEYEVEFTGVGGAFRAIVSLITPDAMQLSTIEGNIEDSTVEVALDFTNSTFSGTTLIPTVIGQLLDDFAASNDGALTLISTLALSDEASDAIQSLFMTESQVFTVADYLRAVFGGITEQLPNLRDVLNDSLRDFLGPLIDTSILPDDWKLDDPIDANNDGESDGDRSLIDMFWLGVVESLMGVPKEAFDIQGLFDRVIQQPDNNDGADTGESDANSEQTSNTRSVRDFLHGIDRDLNRQRLLFDEDDKAELRTDTNGQRLSRPATAKNANPEGRSNSEDAAA